MRTTEPISYSGSPKRSPTPASSVRGLDGATPDSNYRPDVDGLRAIAVLSVIFFHYEIPPFSGGFVGVDIFFVISGFLITRLIIFDLDAGQFTFSNFYLRRARRILPALFFTLAATLGAGVAFFDPSKLEQLALSTIAAVLSVSNFYFWYNVGYFDISADLKPLLHTWSLSVEEQFYLVWPAALFFLYRRMRSTWPTKAMLVLIILGLIAISEVHLYEHAERVFFLAPYRAFEFAIGAACVWLTRTTVRREILLECIAVSGLILIAFSVFVFDKSTRFPGLAALVPCLGAAAVIYAGQARYCGVLLRNRFFVGLGLISYSLYLVHWPLYVFYKHWNFGVVDGADRVILVVASLVLATLMYRYVEQPFRRRVNGVNTVQSARLLYACATFAAVILIPATLAGTGNGWNWRYHPEIRDLLVDPMSQRSSVLVRQRDREPFPLPGRHNALIIGDSHATDLFNALALNDPRVYLKRAGISVLCQPVIRDSLVNDVAESKECDERFRRILTSPKFALNDVDYVLIAARWHAWALDHFDQTIAALRKATSAQIIVFGPAVEFAPEVPTLIARHGRFADSEAFVNQFRVEERARLNERLQKASADLGIAYVDKIALICGEGACPVFVPGTRELIFVDYGHLSNAGAAYFGRLLREKRPDIAKLLLN